MRAAGLVLAAVLPLLAGCDTLSKAGTVGGSLAGGVAGNAIGRDLDAAALRAAREAEYRALEYGGTGTPIAWKQGNGAGEVKPGASYRVNTFDCRDYTHTLMVGTTPPQSARGTACRQANGTWQPVT